MKHLSKCNYQHFYHHRCELKLINNVIISIRFFQDNIHERNDFAAKFSIHTFPDPRLFKYYNYFDFFDFFELQPLKNLLIKMVNLSALLITGFILVHENGCIAT